MKKMLGLLHNWLVNFRNNLYDQNFLKSIDVGRPVISIGNLTMGGTGKTPMVMLLSQYLEKKNISYAIISRSYKSKNKSICQVIPTESNAAVLYGDEPVMLAKKCKLGQVWIGPQKNKTASFVVKNLNPQILIVDDGFQHRRLKRNLDIVMIDASQKMNELDIFPIGRGRESQSSLSRADFVVYSKANLAHVDSFRNLRSQINRPSLELQYTGDLDNIDLAKKYLLASGLGNPDSFERLARQCEIKFDQHIKYADHYQYSLSDFVSLQNKMILNQADGLLVTEKDAVKWQFLLSEKDLAKISVLKIKTEITGATAEFYGKIDKLLC
jgi:tetraacyldisaccharide 4'-kinase